MNLKIREAQLEKVPYMLIVGDKEMAASSVSVRLRSGEDLGIETLVEVKKRIGSAIETRS
jgi:threonyl-tRNA synthetase